MLARECEWAICPQVLQHVQRFLKAANPYSWWIESDADSVELKALVAGAETEVEPTPAQNVDRCDFFRQGGRMSEVVGEHGTHKAQSGDCIRRCHECGNRREIGRREMVGDCQAVVPSRLQSPCTVRPFRYGCRAE